MSWCRERERVQRKNENWFENSLSNSCSDKKNTKYTKTQQNTPPPRTAVRLGLFGCTILFIGSEHHHHICCVKQQQPIHKHTFIFHQPRHRQSRSVQSKQLKNNDDDGDSNKNINNSNSTAISNRKQNCTPHTHETSEKY